MKTSVEHVRLWPAPPEAASQEGDLRRQRGIRETSAAAAAAAFRASARRWARAAFGWRGAELWSGAREAAVAAAAACGAALVRRGWVGLAVQAARLLMALGLRRFLGDVVAHAAAQGQAAALGVLCVAAAQRGARPLGQQLLGELLGERHVVAAAAMAGETRRGATASNSG